MFVANNSTGEMFTANNSTVEMSAANNSIEKSRISTISLRQPIKRGDMFKAWRKLPTVTILFLDGEAGSHRTFVFVLDLGFSPVNVFHDFITYLVFVAGFPIRKNPNMGDMTKIISWAMKKSGLKPKAEDQISELPKR